MQTTIRRIDAHAHAAWPIRFDSLEATLRKTGADAVCLLALPGGSRLDPTPDLLCYKLLHPETTYVFGCLDCTVYERDPLRCGRLFVRRAKRLRALGCDGVKLLEGKPTMRRAFPIPDFDSEAWEPFWSYAEKTRLPILWHVNDPEQFWNPETVSEYAKACGWAYGEDDVNNEAQYRQVRAVFKRHPLLNATLAHFFFLSADLPRLSEWLDRFPNLHVDCAPGIELFENLSKSFEETKLFFQRYAGRVQYGTDIGGRAALRETVETLDEAESLRRVEIIDAFLLGGGERVVEADGRYLIQTKPFALRGIHLDEAAANRIYRDNFLSFVGGAPRTVRVRAIRRFCRFLSRGLNARARRLGVPADLGAVAYDQSLIRAYLRRNSRLFHKKEWR